MAAYQRALQRVLARVYRLWAPPPELKLSEWADEYAYLSPESAAEPGKWHSLPYQVSIMDALTDPLIERVTMMKSARVGYTKMINHLIGYHVHLDPCNILVVQPTVEDAQGYSKDEIAPMIRDTPELINLVKEPRSKDSDNTILKKAYPGGVLYLVGANSGRGFRRIGVRIVIFDDIDGYPPSAGTEGDQLKLGIKRTDAFWNRKIIMGSTPTTKGDSKIEREFEKSDKRYRWVPCPKCNEYQVLKWSGIQWPRDEPELAYYVCEHCDHHIDHSQKRWMVERGQWRPSQAFNGHAGFHIWAGYSYSPNAAWGILAREFVDCSKDSELLQVFINTTLAETWQEETEQPDWAPLLKRVEDYDAAAGAGLVITAGVDVQKDRLELGIEAWGPGEENYLVEYLYLYGDTDKPEVWTDLQAKLNRAYQNERGSILDISITCIDSGYRTDMVYWFCRKNAARRVYATKGIGGAGLPIVDRATKKNPGDKLTPARRFNLGVDGAKAVIYHRLNTTEPGPRYRHFPSSVDQEYFEGLTAEKIVTKKRRGFEFREWQLTRPRNEPLDIAVLNYAGLKIINPNWDDLIEHGGGLKVPELPAPRVSGRFERQGRQGFERR